MFPAVPNDHERTVAREARDSTALHPATGSGADPDPAATCDAVPHAPPVPTEVVPGFVITGEIARGGMGVVLSALEVSLQREVAIKMLLPGALGADRATRRFVEEARITAQLSHPGIPPIHQVGTLNDGRPFLAMKLIRGRTLSTILAAREQRTSSQSAEELDLTALYSPGLLHIFEQICHAVGYAHSQGVVHRDLKPANVMVGNFGEVQVMDWGIARGWRLDPADPDRTRTRAFPDQSSHVTGLPALTQVGQAMGTPQYMPPEQARGEWDRVGPRADVFALGGILSVILTGQPPYTGASPYAVLKRAETADLTECLSRLSASGADPDLIDLARRCLSADPEGRPANGAEVAQLIAAHRLSIESRLVTAEAERAVAASKVDHYRVRAISEEIARHGAEERAARAARQAEQFARQVSELMRLTKHQSRRWWWTVTVALAFFCALLKLYTTFH